MKGDLRRRIQVPMRKPIRGLIPVLIQALTLVPVLIQVLTLGQMDVWMISDATCVLWGL